MDKMRANGLRAAAVSDAGNSSLSQVGPGFEEDIGKGSGPGTVEKSFGGVVSSFSSSLRIARGAGPSGTALVNVLGVKGGCCSPIGGTMDDAAAGGTGADGPATGGLKAEADGSAAGAAGGIAELLNTSCFFRASNSVGVRAPASSISLSWRRVSRGEDGLFMA